MRVYTYIYIYIESDVGACMWFMYEGMERLYCRDAATVGRHLTDTLQTPYRHLTDTLQTPYRHLTDTLQTPYRHHTCPT